MSSVVSICFCILSSREGGSEEDIRKQSCWLPAMAMLKIRPVVPRSSSSGGFQQRGPPAAVLFCGPKLPSWESLRVRNVWVADLGSVGSLGGSCWD